MVRSLYKSAEDSPGGAKELFMMVQASLNDRNSATKFLLSFHMSITGVWPMWHTIDAHPSNPSHWLGNGSHSAN